MSDTADDWRLGAAAGLPDDAFVGAVERRFGQIYDAVFAADPWVNHDLPIELRARRETPPWRVFLLLTPWMLARLFLPRRSPNLPVPPGWRADERADDGYAVIGPAVQVELCGALQAAHVNYDAELGHYLIQPLVQSMEPYAHAEEVFAAWDAVLTTRQRVMDESRRECVWQRELSRREFLARLRGG